MDHVIWFFQSWHRKFLCNSGQDLVTQYYLLCFVCLRYLCVLQLLWEFVFCILQTGRQCSNIIARSLHHRTSSLHLWTPVLATNRYIYTVCQLYIKINTVDFSFQIWTMLTWTKLFCQACFSKMLQKLFMV